MAGDIFETLGIFDAESEEISQMENVNCLNIELITEKVQSLTAISSDSNTQRLLGTVATDPVSGESRHFSKKIPSFSSAERFCNHDRSFLRMIEATEVLLLGPPSNNFMISIEAVSRFINWACIW